LDLGGGWSLDCSRVEDWELLGSCRKLVHLGTLQPRCLPPPGE
jgi:hypothetical protein